MKRRVLNIAIALDQFAFCVLTLGHSDPDETMSSAAWRMEQAGKFFGFMRPVIDVIFFFDPDHCLQSYLKERRP